MSAVKHQPATPLPFKEFAPEIGGEVKQDYRYIEGGCGYCTESAIQHGDVGFSLAGSILPQDAAYIAHAANAYPKLVEALRYALKSMEQERDVKLRVDPNIVIHAAPIGICATLLRELGEDA